MLSILLSLLMDCESAMLSDFVSDADWLSEMLSLIESDFALLVEAESLIEFTSL